MSGSSNQARMNDDNLIVIDSDDEDEVIFVNEDRGATLAETMAPGFLENLPKTNEPEVRQLFDNVVKIPAESNTNPIVVERSFNDSPVDELDEEQIELPSYNVQFRKISDSPNNPLRSPVRVNMVDNNNLNKAPIGNANKEGEMATLTPMPKAPVIKLTPLAKLQGKPFIPLDEVIETGAIQVNSVPKRSKTTGTARKSRQKIVYKPSPPKNPPPPPPPPPQEKQAVSPLKPSELSPLPEKKTILHKLIPNNDKTEWSWEDTLKKTENFIMELRKSDCELDIAEEALFQTNIKLTFDFECVLSKLYSLCPNENDSDGEMQPARHPRYKPEKDETSKTLQVVEEPKEEEPITQEPLIEKEEPSDSIKSPEHQNEECQLLNNLLGDVKESAKTHLLNFDLEVPYKEFLPPSLLHWDQPKTKTEILDELMFLESAISKCSFENDNLRKVSGANDIFKYETDLELFHKEFNIDCDDRKTVKEDVSLDCNHQEEKVDVKLTKNEIKETSEGMELKGNTIMEPPPIVTIKQVKKQPQTSPKKNRKRRRKRWGRRKSHMKVYQSQENLDIIDDSTKDVIEDIDSASEGSNSLVIDTSAASDTENDEKAENNRLLDEKKEGLTHDEELNDDLTPEASWVDLKPVLNYNAKTSLDDKSQVLSHEDALNADAIPEVSLVDVKPVINESLTSNHVCDIEPAVIVTPKVGKVKRSRRARRTNVQYVEGARATRAYAKKYNEVFQEVCADIVQMIDDRKDEESYNEPETNLETEDDGSGTKSEDFDSIPLADIKKSLNIVETPVQEEVLPIQVQVPKRKWQRKLPNVPLADVKRSLNIVEIPETPVQEEVLPVQVQVPKRKWQRKSPIVPLADIKRSLNIVEIPETPVQEEVLPVQVEVPKKKRMKKSPNIPLADTNKPLNVVEMPEIPVEEELSSVQVQVPMKKAQKRSPKKRSYRRRKKGGKKPSKAKAVTVVPDNPPLADDDDDVVEMVRETKVEPLEDSAQTSDQEIVESTEEQGTSRISGQEGDETHEQSSSHVTAGQQQVDPTEQQGSMQLISNCFSIDPSLFDNIDDSFDEIPTEMDLCETAIALDEIDKIDSMEKNQDMSSSSSSSKVSAAERNEVTKTNLSADGTPSGNSSEGAESTEAAQSVSSVDLTDGNTKSVSTDKSVSPVVGPMTDGACNDATSSSDEPNSTTSLPILSPGPNLITHCSSPLPLDMSVKITLPPSPKETPLTASNQELSQPLNLSSKETFPVDKDVIDFSVKTKNSSPTHTVTELTSPLDDIQEPFDLSKPNSSGDVTIETPRSIFSRGRQIYTDPGNYQRVSTDSNNSYEASVKDNLISEITDILVNMTGESNCRTSTGSLDEEEQRSGAPHLEDLSKFGQVPLGSVGEQQQAQNTINNQSGFDRQSPPSNFKIDKTTVDPSQLWNRNALEPPLVTNKQQSHLTPDVKEQEQVSPMHNIPEPRPAVKDDEKPSFPTLQSPPLQNVSPRDPRLANKTDSTTGNFNIRDPRFRRQSTQSQESSSDSERLMMSPDPQIPNLNVRDPRLARKLGSVNSPTHNAPNQDACKVATDGNRNDSEQSKTNSKIEVEFDSDDEDEAKQRQNLLRKSIEKLIVSNLQEEVRPKPVESLTKTIATRFESITAKMAVPPNQDVQSSVKSSSDNIQSEEKEHTDLESSNDSSEQANTFTRNRVLRSPPMVRKTQSDETFDSIKTHQASEVRSCLRPRRGNPVYTNENDDEDDGACDKLNKRQSHRRTVKNLQDEECSSVNSEDVLDDKESPKKKVNLAEYRARRKSDKHHSVKHHEEVTTGKTKSDGKVVRARKRVIDSDEDYNDGNNDCDHSDIDDQQNEHKSDVKNKKCEVVVSTRDRKSHDTKREPLMRRTKFLDDLPDVDVNKSVVPQPMKHLDRSRSKESSGKTTSHIVRKTITTERIVTKRVSDPTSSKSKIFKPDKDTKYLQERITLKVNEKAAIDNRRGIDFKCGALKEGEILKVVGGRLVRVRKRVSSSDEELEKERSKLRKGLTSLKFKKKSDATLAKDDNKYNVLSEDGVKSSLLETLQGNLQDESDENIGNPGDNAKNRKSLSIDKMKGSPTTVRPSNDAFDVAKLNSDVKKQLDLAKRTSSDSFDAARDSWSQSPDTSKRTNFDVVKGIMNVLKKTSMDVPTISSSPDISRRTSSEFGRDGGYSQSPTTPGRRSLENSMSSVKTPILDASRIGQSPSPNIKSGWRQSPSFDNSLALVKKPTLDAVRISSSPDILRRTNSETGRDSGHSQSPTTSGRRSTDSSMTLAKKPGSDVSRVSQSPNACRSVRESGWRQSPNRANNRDVDWRTPDSSHRSSFDTDNDNMAIAKKPNMDVAKVDWSDPPQTDSPRQRDVRNDRDESYMTVAKKQTMEVARKGFVDVERREKVIFTRRESVSRDVEFWSDSSETVSSRRSNTQKRDRPFEIRNRAAFSSRRTEISKFSDDNGGSAVRSRRYQMEESSGPWNNSTSQYNETMEERSWQVSESRESYETWNNQDWYPPSDNIGSEHHERLQQPYGWDERDSRDDTRYSNNNRDFDWDYERRQSEHFRNSCPQPGPSDSYRASPDQYHSYDSYHPAERNYNSDRHHPDYSSNTDRRMGNSRQPMRSRNPQNNPQRQGHPINNRNVPWDSWYP